MAKGAPDPSFGVAGVVQTPFTMFGALGTWDVGTAVVLQSNGKILAAGYSGGLFVPADFLIARYNEDGSLDSTFGNGGVTQTNFGQLGIDSNDVANDIALQGTEKIIVAGRSSAYNVQDFA